MPEAGEPQSNESVATSESQALANELGAIIASRDQPTTIEATPDADSAATLEALDKLVTISLDNSPLRSLNEHLPDGMTVQELLTDPGRKTEVRALAQEVRILRNVNSSYRINYPGIIELDTIACLSAGYNGTPTPLTEFGKSLITDRPLDELTHAQWLQTLERAQPHDVAQTVKLAEQNQAAVSAEYTDRPRFEAIGAAVGRTADQVHKMLWEQASDRRSGLAAIESLAATATEPGLKTAVADLVMRPSELRLDYVPPHTEAAARGLQPGLTFAREAAGKDFDAVYVSLLQLTDTPRMTNLVNNLNEAQSPTQTAVIDAVLNTAAATDVEDCRTVILDFAMGDITTEGSVQARTRDLQALNESGVFTTLARETIRDAAPGILKAVINHTEPVATYNLLRDMIATPYIDGLITDSNIGKTVAASIGENYEGWLQVGRDMPARPDKALGQYVKRHLELAILPPAGKDTIDVRGFERPTETLQALRGFELPASMGASASQAREVELLRAVIDRETTDKLPTNAAKLKNLIQNPENLAAYQAILALKAEGSGQDILERAQQAGIITQELADLLNATATTRDASEIIPDLRNLTVKQAEWNSARTRWLSEYGAQSTKTSRLTTAWDNREVALAHGSGDTPGEILQWAAVNGLKVYAEQQRSGGNSDTLSSEDLDRYQNVASELSSRYPVEQAYSALSRYAKAEAAGMLRRADFAPGTTTVTSDDASYTVEVFNKTDPRGFSIGFDTGCCMTLGGASETCIWAGYEDPKYGFMAVYKDGRLRAQSVVYLGADNETMVVDNIEANRGTDIVNLVDVYQKGITELLNRGALRGTVQRVNVGLGYSDADLSSLPEAITTPAPDPNVYTDARRQRVLLDRSA